MKYDRFDKKLEHAVNRGLAAALLIDVRAGIKVMTDEHVPPAVISRVILTPQNRRSTDWHH